MSVDVLDYFSPALRRVVRSSDGTVRITYDAKALMENSKIRGVEVLEGDVRVVVDSEGPRIEVGKVTFRRSTSVEAGGGKRKRLQAKFSVVFGELELESATSDEVAARLLGVLREVAEEAREALREIHSRGWRRIARTPFRGEIVIERPYGSLILHSALEIGDSRVNDVSASGKVYVSGRVGEIKVGREASISEFFDELEGVASRVMMGEDRRPLSDFVDDESIREALIHIFGGEDAAVAAVLRSFRDPEELVAEWVAENICAGAGVTVDG